MKLLKPDSLLWPLLFANANPVTDYATEVLPHLPEMLRIMISKKAVGLAAPQVGVPLRFFVYRKSVSDVYRIVVNPKITWRSTYLKGGYEGCLSFPGHDDQIVQRPDSVRVEYTASNGDEMTRLLTGMEARIFQHEFDHLNGVTIYPQPVAQLSA